jgi:Ran GTPase-activating protein (RanGAP) involved in mRNA processing and transport
MTPGHQVDSALNSSIFNMLTEALVPLTNLQQLDLSRNNFKDETSEELVKFLIQVPNL